MRLSYWEYDSLFKKIDVAVIGAGITGLTAATELAIRRPSWRIVVFEKALIGAAASSRNAGFGCFGSVSEIMADIQVYGEEEVVRLVNKRRHGLDTLLDRHGRSQLAFSKVGGFELFSDQEEFDKNESCIDHINAFLGENVFEVNCAPTYMKVHDKMICNPHEGHLNTGKLYQSLERKATAAGVKIIRGYKIVEVKEGTKNMTLRISGLDAQISAPHVLITTNALTHQFIPELDVVPSRNQVLITKPITEHNITGTYHMNKGYLYFRDVGDQLLIGGARDRFPEEQTEDLGINETNQKYLLDTLRSKILPHREEEIEVDMQWSGLLAGGKKRSPIVERKGSRITIAVRLGGMGVAIGTSIGLEAATLVMNDTF